MSTYRLTRRAHRLVRLLGDLGLIAMVCGFIWLFFTTLLAWWAS